MQFLHYSFGLYYVRRSTFRPYIEMGDRKLLFRDFVRVVTLLAEIKYFLKIMSCTMGHPLVGSCHMFDV